MSKLKKLFELEKQGDKEALSLINSGEEFKIRYDNFGFPVALTIGKIDIIHLNPTCRTDACVKELVKRLNLTQS